MGPLTMGLVLFRVEVGVLPKGSSAQGDGVGSVIVGGDDPPQGR